MFNVGQSSEVEAILYVYSKPLFMYVYVLT